MSILSAMTMLEKSWNAVSNKTFTDCFKKADISEKEVEKVLNDEDDSFAGLDEIEEDTRSKLLQVKGNRPTKKFLLKQLMM